MKNLSSRTPASNEILYTSADGKVIEPHYTFYANIVSNTYKDGQGVIVFYAHVTSIGDYAFYKCSSLRSVTFGNRVTSIGEHAFSRCSSLTSFYGKFASSDNRCLIVDGVLNSFAPANLTSYTIPDSVTKIGSLAFSGCSSLTSVTIPDSVTVIEQQAFDYCGSLTSVYCKSTTPPAGNYDMFDDNASGRKIYVPTESVNAYKSAEYWKDYASAIVGYDF